MKRVVMTYGDEHLEQDQVPRFAALISSGLRDLIPRGGAVSVTVRVELEDVPPPAPPRRRRA